GYGLWLPTLALTPLPRIDTATVADGHAGWSVANAGDVNGDGLSDVIVGLPDADGGTGQVHIYHGTPTGPGATPVLVFTGTAPGDRYGASVATAGDVNGDGYADVVIGAPGGSGRVTVHLGGPGGVATDVATVLTGTPGSLFGAAVSTAGDVNCDGMADVVVGAPGAGMVHVHQGSPTGLLVPAALSIPAPQPGSGFGTSVATAGDVNGDGYSDIIIGAPDFSNGQAGEGAAFVHLGSPDGVVPAAHRQLEGNVAGLAFGTSVAGAGDVNGNGCSDVVVGAPMHAPNGAIHVFHGSLAGLSTVADYTYAMPGGAGNAARFGTAVAEGGDIDGNGLADIVVGAPYASAPQTNEGRVYVLLSMPVGAPNITYLESNVAGRRIGWSVAGGGDIDGDGFSDIIAGAPFTIGTDGTETGAVYFCPGNAKKGLSRPARQYQADLVSPLSTNSEDYMNTDYFGVGLLTRSHMQRKPGRLHWEVVHEGMPFTGAPNIATSVASQGSTPYVDLGLAGVEIKQLLYKQPGFLRYKWRVRAEYPLHRTAADGQRFSKWHYGYASAHGDIGVLPVELLQLDGIPLVPGNLISWATASETGTSHFTVERSTDLAAWQAIGEVAAAGNSPTTTAYELLDTDAPTGLSYYRLQVVDLDGTAEPSPTVAVHRGAGDHMQVYPNPATDARLYWQGPAGARRARVHDAAGRMVLDRPAAPGTNGSIELGALSAGHYTLLLVDAQGRALARAPFIRP
ncbi:MAG: VCBS repeat-containing protein, partial [Flavobacteriales bacterium]|nr:VCBS repeat-containing protein [Flavobacteriales bacterium]